LKYKSIFIDRRAGQDRRVISLSLWKNKIERRKRPDRRMGGVNVDVLNIPEEDFLDIFAVYLS
jgi:hypothetical protein